MTAELVVDHLVYATPDLNRAIDQIESLLGVRPAIGGRHVGRGTHNALVALGEDVYLEIIAPDPEQPDPPAPRAFGLDNVGGGDARLVTWAAKSDDVESVRAVAETSGIFLGGIQEGSRQRPDGVTLSWRYTNPATVVADGLVPFFIDWGKSLNPAASAPRGARLVALRAEHPDAASVVRQLRRLGIELPVTPGRQHALIATIDSPRGRVELR